tara:strand:+ start:36 stop:551 length:516 start_codon:yes stop_codon:yes gene_type:complete
VIFISRFLAVICIFAATLTSDNADSHEQKTSITVMLANKNTGFLEISHRFNIHDSEHALTELFGTSADIIKDVSAQSRFSQYIQERFALRTSEQVPIATHNIGHEVDGKFFWVYQEAALAPSVSAIEIYADALHSVWKKQTNFVNIEGLGPIQSLRFTLNSGWQAVRLKPI